MEKYRIRFCKEGRAKYISHLDLLKVFTRCGRRIDLDLEYSQGFNPHAEIVFSAPLPLGMTSEAEYVDLQLAHETDPDKLLELLKRSLPSGIVPLKIRKLEQGEGSVMKPVRYARYRLEARTGGNITPEIFSDSVKRCLDSNEPVMTAKKSKSGTKVVDIRPMIVSFGTDFNVIDGNNMSFEAVLAAGNEVNLRPEVAFKGIIDKLNGTDPSKAPEDAALDETNAPVSCKLLTARKLEFLDFEQKPLW